MSPLWREHCSRVLTVWGCWCGVRESKLLVCVQTCVCFSVLICMGVCFSCGPSNGHKAGSVCPLGCWNVHFGQQAASVLNRSCLSYCTSRTMSFSFSLYLSFSLCLSLFMTIYRLCFQPETGEDKLWLVADVPAAASLCLTHGQCPCVRHRNLGLVTFRQHRCFDRDRHGIRGPTQVIAEGELSEPGLPGGARAHMLVCELYAWVKRNKRVDVMWGVYGCSPPSHDQPKTTRPHDVHKTLPALKKYLLIHPRGQS